MLSKLHFRKSRSLRLCSCQSLQALVEKSQAALLDVSKLSTLQAWDKGNNFFYLHGRRRTFSRVVKLRNVYYIYQTCVIDSLRT